MCVLSVIWLKKKKPFTSRWVGQCLRRTVISYNLLGSILFLLLLVGDYKYSLFTSCWGYYSFRVIQSVVIVVNLYCNYLRFESVFLLLHDYICIHTETQCVTSQLDGKGFMKPPIQIRQETSGRLSVKHKVNAKTPPTIKV